MIESFRYCRSRRRRRRPVLLGLLLRLPVLHPGRPFAGAERQGRRRGEQQLREGRAAAAGLWRGLLHLRDLFGQEEAEEAEGGGGGEGQGGGGGGRRAQGEAAAPGRAANSRKDIGASFERLLLIIHGRGVEGWGGGTQ